MANKAQFYTFEKGLKSYETKHNGNYQNLLFLFACLFKSGLDCNHRDPSPRGRRRRQHIIPTNEYPRSHDRKYVCVRRLMWSGETGNFIFFSRYHDYSCWRMFNLNLVESLEKHIILEKKGCSKKKKTKTKQKGYSL